MAGNRQQSRFLALVSNGERLAELSKTAAESEDAAALQVLKTKLFLLEEEKRRQELEGIKGEQSNIEFGSQIRSYVLHPYSMIKDHRTNVETSNVNKVLDGDLDLFIESYLKRGN